MGAQQWADYGTASETYPTGMSLRPFGWASSTKWLWFFREPSWGERGGELGLGDPLGNWSRSEEVGGCLVDLHELVTEQPHTKPQGARTRVPESRILSERVFVGPPLGH